MRSTGRARPCMASSPPHRETDCHPAAPSSDAPSRRQTALKTRGPAPHRQPTPPVGALPQRPARGPSAISAAVGSRPQCLRAGAGCALDNGPKSAAVSSTLGRKGGISRAPLAVGRAGIGSTAGGQAHRRPPGRDLSVPGERSGMSPKPCQPQDTGTLFVGISYATAPVVSLGHGNATFSALGVVFDRTSRNRPAWLPRGRR